MCEYLKNISAVSNKIFLRQEIVVDCKQFTKITGLSKVEIRLLFRSQGRISNLQHQR